MPRLREFLRAVALVLVVGSCVVGEISGCAWWQRRANDWVCPDHTESCECMNPDNGLGCQEPTDPNNPMMFGSGVDGGTDAR